MTEEEWDALPIETVPLHKLVWMLNGIDLNHIFPTIDATTASGPIRVSRLNRGYLVRDGRHRVIRALLDGHTHIPARIGWA